tara:strand:- start:25 stop:381 length:357 start_codon:yes stop_codon:yes gene_type:complete
VGEDKQRLAPNNEKDYMNVSYNIMKTETIGVKMRTYVSSQIDEVITEHIEETKAENGGDYFIDKQYPLYGQMTENIVKLCADIVDDLDDIVKDIVIERLFEHEEELVEIEKMITSDKQ